MRKPRTFFQNYASFIAASGVVSALSGQQLGCSSTPPGSGFAPAPGPQTGSQDALGSLGVALAIPGGEMISTLNWVITGPNGASTVVLSGSETVQNSDAISLIIGGVPSGSGYTITLTGTTTDGLSMCSGSAGFAVTARTTTNATVAVQCSVPSADAGSLQVGAQVYTCGTLNSISASPSDTNVGNPLSLTSSATAPNGGTLTYAWSAPSGTFSAPTAANTNYTCAAPGAVTVILTVGDGAVPDGGTCSPVLSMLSATIECDAVDGAAISDSGGTDSGGTDSGGADSGSTDAGGADSGSTDAGGSDSGSTDAGGSDAGTSDAGASDGGSATINLAVYRVGDTAASLASTGNPVFIDVFTTAGVLVQSIAMPTVQNSTATTPHRLIASGTATSEGLLTLSTNGKYLLATGYDSAPFSDAGSVVSSSSAAVPRTVARIDSSGDIDTTTGLTDFASGNNPRSAASNDGVNIWVAGASSGARFTTLGSSTSTSLNTANLRQAGIFNSVDSADAGPFLQLYASSGSANVQIGTLGAGLPMASATFTILPGYPTSGSPYGFFFADLDAVPGVDTLYVADDTAADAGTTGGVTKYSLVGSSWVSNGELGSASDSYRGLTGVVSGTTVTLYAVRKGGTSTTGGGEVVSIVDSSGYNHSFSGATLSAALATAASKTAYRGIAIFPHP
ncbi:MAG: hypothetical protein WBY94_01410 [Polyangiaceae bacterium]